VNWPAKCERSSPGLQLKVKRGESTFKNLEIVAGP
jgi:hypothetical protein